ncbi:MAG: hypothetical protein DYG90_10180, partial [Chloroflexi bacterium CFX6]|nr:hypothetical protein [Chloroflexi bacterium CFX6]
MFNRVADWLERQPPGRRRLYTAFIAITLLTVPCYGLGMLLLFLNAPPADGPAAPTPGVASVTPPVTATATGT